MNESFAVTDFPQNMVRGPLGSVIPAYAALLFQQGYTQQSIRQHIRFLTDMNQWVEQQGIQLGDLTEPTIQRYMLSRHQRLRPRRDDASILRRLLDLLYTQGLLPRPVSATLDNPLKPIEHDFDRYLSQERGLSMSTRINYRFFIRLFLSARFSDKPVCFNDLSAEEVIQFIRNQASGLSPKRAGLMTAIVSAISSPSWNKWVHPFITAELALRWAQLPYTLFGLMAVTRLPIDVGFRLRSTQPTYLPSP